MKIPFTKMHGLGNDYIYVWAPLLPPDADLAALSIRWSDRHTGIGSDGLILIAPAHSAAADFSMRIFNADGSEALMCGNGARCVARYLYTKRLTHKETIRLETLSGIKQLMIHLDDNDTSSDSVSSVTVDMGSTAAEEAMSVETGRGTFTGVAVNVGNPHLVLFVDDALSVPVHEIGPELEHSPRFPDGVNVEFAQVLDPHHIRMRVWERGSGITQACGTGACATAVACAKAGLTDAHDCEVTMDGGALILSWNPTTSHVLMTGTAVTVFEGTIEL